MIANMLRDEPSRIHYEAIYNNKYLSVEYWHSSMFGVKYGDLNSNGDGFDGRDNSYYLSSDDHLHIACEIWYKTFRESMSLQEYINLAQLKETTK